MPHASSCFSPASHRARGQVLLSRRLNTGFRDGQWGLPAGHVNPGESITAAAVREVVWKASPRQKP
ncbi:MAG: NUDIX domain-containing protein, partial [Promethearchaeia archaeon]